MLTKDKIKEILKEQFSVEQLEVADDSAKHTGHAEAIKFGGGHFSVFMISKDFAGKRLIDRHRMIYEALKSLKSEVHALAITAKTPTEQADRNFNSRLLVFLFAFLIQL